ncbi:MAG: ADP-heptose--LPS heptosyltransferase [Gemmatales bacterium]|nr:MAG: ADP-heptose--LPS heptosyltransferase [Gemmatales bacterium]
MKIALFLPNWIGDAVMATPAIRAVREHFADAFLIAVYKPYIAGVFEGCPWFDAVVHLDKKGPYSARWWSAAVKLRRFRPELALLFPNSFRSAWVAWLAGCRRRIGFARYGRSPLLTDALEPIRDERGQLKPSPIIQAYNQLAEHAGCPKASYRMELFTTPASEVAADLVWRRAELDRCPAVVCMNPGAAFGAAKFWPMDYWVELSRMIADRLHCGVLVLCGPNEQRLSREIAGRACHPLVHSLAGAPLSIGLTKACIRRCDLLITTDSGPRHFAAAFDRPVVTLFGPTHIEWTETFYPKAIHLQKKVDCGPCQLRVCPFDHRCMKLLVPDDVFHAAWMLLHDGLRRKERKTG